MARRRPRRRDPPPPTWAPSGATGLRFGGGGRHCPRCGGLPPRL